MMSKRQEKKFFKIFDRLPYSEKQKYWYSSEKPTLGMLTRKKKKKG